ncbi:hypothetical protein Tco_0250924, partial [Tanacetum coccineum]
MSIRFMKNDIREKYLIDVRLGQCQRAKQCALFDHEGGLVEQYSKLWQYTQAILDTNPGSTCELEIEVNDEDGKIYCRRVYVCFHGVKHRCLEGCRKIIGLDGCFLTHTCKGQLLTAMGRDANNQMDDLNLGDGGGISMISYRHKVLIQVVADWLPNAEHRQCTRHAAAATLIEIVFLQKMEEIKMLDEKAHEWLVERNPNSWCRSYFEMDRCSAAFENEISESFNSRILQARGKPIIIMLEGIMVYLMQRMWCMNKLAFDNKDSITP